MPRTAHHGNALKAFLSGAAQACTHVCLAPHLLFRRNESRAVAFRPHFRHEFADGVEQFKPVHPLFNHGVPPCLAVFIAGNGGNVVQRIKGPVFRLLFLRRLLL